MGGKTSWFHSAPLSRPPTLLLRHLCLEHLQVVWKYLEINMCQKEPESVWIKSFDLLVLIV